MLFYVGKDVFRWIDQCVDTCGRSPQLSGLGISEASFSHLLIKQTPEDVAEKLKSWGVIEYARIFARSIGIFNQFCEPPPQDLLQPDYLRSYYRYADYAYSCWRDAKKYAILPAAAVSLHALRLGRVHEDARGAVERIGRLSRRRSLPVPTRSIRSEVKS